MTAIAIIMLGFFLGMRHATDPDHVIAVTTIVSRQRSVRHAAWIGVLWGCGHTLTIFLVGSAIILFGVVIPPRLGLTMELSVGLMLILLGILNLWGPPSLRFGASAGSPHSHGASAEFPPSHGHTENATPVSWMDRQFKNLGVYQTIRPLVVGIVHGLAGSAAVALLVLTTIRNPYWAIVYLLVFGIGTVAGMMTITAAIALPFTYSSAHFSRINRGMGIASGLISVGFGLFIVYQMGYVNGILTSHPSWTPH
ncbi:MAG TPA: hypothetical protein VGI16_02135 [Candidatus Acidoferrum sp.]